MVKAVIARLRLRRLVELAIHVPLAHMARRVAGSLQQRGYGDLAAADVYFVSRREIPRIYLGDAVVEAALIGGWLAAR